MNIALQLLISAMTLLTMVNSNPNLPQSFRDNAIQIANTAVSYAQQVIANGGSKEGVQIPPISLPSQAIGGIVESTMKPAYTLDELIAVFDANTAKSDNYQHAYLYKLSPGRVGNISSTTVDITAGIAIDPANKGDLIFQGKNYGMGPINATDLTPNTEYHYQFVYHENGREDTVIDKTFKTLTQ